MKTLLILYTFIGNISMNTLSEIRKDFMASADDKAFACRLQQLTDAQDFQHDPLMEGYKGVSLIMDCKYENNPFSKLADFRTGKKYIEEAIDAQPGNAELHFLRYTVQTNAPSWLGYHGNMAADKAVLMSYLAVKDNKDPELYHMISDYMLQSGYCSHEEIMKIKSVN